MLEEEAYTCLWDLLETIPTLDDDQVTVHQEIVDFNREWPTHARARLIDRDHRIVDASRLGLDAHDRLERAGVVRPVTDPTAQGTACGKRNSPGGW